MIIIGIPELKFPSYEKLKELRNNKEYEFIIFETGIDGTYGRFTLYEDGKNTIIFDLIEDGYSDKNSYTMIRNFTQRGYKQVCVRAQNCYNDLFKALKNGNDCSWMWEFEYRG